MKNLSYDNVDDPSGHVIVALIDCSLNVTNSRKSENDRRCMVEKI
jgi:hypothetical protein